MKKLYFLDEEEKNRILNLHESATKRQYLSEQSLGPVKVPEVGPKREGVARDANWTGIYACVPKAKGAELTKLSDGSTAYILNGFVYYNNGMKRKQPVKNNSSIKYTCNDPEFKTDVKTDDKAKIQQYKQQIVTKTTDTTKQIQKLLGLTETGVMDSGLLQKINDKLNGGGTSSAPATSSSAPATSSSAPATSSSTPATSSSTPAYNFNIDPNIGKDGINFNPMTPEQIAQGVQSATPPKLPTRDELIAKAKADLKAARQMK